MFNGDVKKPGLGRRSLVSGVVALAFLAGACGPGEADDDVASVASIAEVASDTASGSPGDTASSDVDGGDDSDGSSAAGGEVSDEDAEAAQLRYDQCMADLGIDEDELFGDGTATIDDSQYDALISAQEECRPILEAVFGSFELSPEQEAAQQDADAKFSQCMSDWRLMKHR